MSKDVRYGLACQMPCKFDGIIAACTLLTSSCFRHLPFKAYNERCLVFARKAKRLNGQPYFMIWSPAKFFNGNIISQQLKPKQEHKVWAKSESSAPKSNCRNREQTRARASEQESERQRERVSEWYKNSKKEPYDLIRFINELRKAEWTQCTGNTHVFWIKVENKL